MASVNNLFERQQSLKLHLPKSVAVVGCGGVGSYVADYLAMAGVPELWLFDGDHIEKHNLNRIRLPLDAVGKVKSVAVRESIQEVRPECSVVSMGHFSPEMADSVNLADNIQWIAVTTDTARSRRMVREWAENKGINYIEAAAEGEIGSATGEPADWSTPQEDNPGYASVPVWISPCVSSALIAVSHIVHGKPMNDLTIRAGWDDTTNRFRFFEAGA